MSLFDQELKLESIPGTSNETFIKNGPHWAPMGRPIMGAIIMSQALLVAYKTIPASFQIHHATAQFFHAGTYKSPLKFEVLQINNSKNNAARTVCISQDEKKIAIIVMTFMRKPLNDNLSLTYQPIMPEVDEPEENVNDISQFGQGIIQAQVLDMVYNPTSPDFSENRCRNWLRIGGPISPLDATQHHQHIGLLGLTDVFLLDVSARLHNLQLGLGEGPIGPDLRTSPFNKSTKRHLRPGENRPEPDFTALVTLNHTVHFHDLSGLKADDWVLMEGFTTSAFGSRVMCHSKLWSRDGVLRATCTQEAYYRLKKEAAMRLKSKF